MTNKLNFFTIDEKMAEYIINRSQLMVITKNPHTMEEVSKEIVEAIKSLNVASQKYLVEQLIILENDPDGVYIREIKNGQVASVLKKFVLENEKCAKAYNQQKTKKKKMGIIDRFVFMDKAKELALDLSGRSFIKKEDYQASTEDIIARQAKNMQYLTSAKKFLNFVADIDEKTLNSMYNEFKKYDKFHKTNILGASKYVIENKAEVLEMLRDVRKNCIAVDELIY